VRTIPILLATASLTALSACSSNDTADAVATITVESTADACELSQTDAPSGTIVFSVRNSGSEVTEFYLYDADDGVVGEVENIGPDLTRDLTVEVEPGTYTTACKPGMVGDGIRAPFTVTDG